MGTAEIIVVIVAAIVVAALVVVFVSIRKHPEDSSGHRRDPPDAGDATGRGVLPGEVDERPAGPAAEGQSVSEPGRSVPGS